VSTIVFGKQRGGIIELIFLSPDGKKKAYVRLTSDHDALDVANKVGSLEKLVLVIGLLTHLS
jgi:hypothetical protein